MKIIGKIYRRLIFGYVLIKKTIFQKLVKNGKNYDYLTNRERELKGLLEKEQVSKESAQEYFNALNDDLYDYLRSSGISYKDICTILSGKILYNRSGFTPDKVQQVLVDNYCKTNGLFQEVFFDFMYRNHNKNFKTSGFSSLFGKIDVDLISKISAEVKETGYSKLPFTIPKDKVDAIVNWSKEQEYTMIDDSLNGKFFKAKIDFNNSIYTKALALEADLKNNDRIMEICNDEVLLSIIQTVLGAKVDILHLGMWWTFKNEKPSSVAAQYFHYDLDALRWLKVFVYLTDVDTNSGPHIAIPGSHAIGGKNYKLLQKRYERITDEEMAKNQVGEISEFNGKAGTIIIGDTRCWHKGKEVLEGNRLMLQPTYAPTELLKKLI